MTRESICMFCIKRSDPSRFWLYVGQAYKLSERISGHNNPIHRRAQPSLHYHVWDSVENMVSKFFSLAVHINTVSKDNQLILNFQEMWMACILTAKHLADYLPKDANKAWAGRHLNVVPPIWQGFTGDSASLREAIGGMEGFQDFFNSPDPAIRAWAWDIQHAFNDLRSSPDPAHRSYYFSVMAENNKRAEEACQRRKIEYLQRVLSGRPRTIGGGDDIHSLHIVSCGVFHFTVSRSLNLGVQVGDEVRLQFHLTETPNPKMYATEALPTDPASR